MNLALKVADLSECKFKHGTVITSGGKPLIVAPNIDKLLPIDNRFREQIRRNPSKAAKARRERSISTHAEVNGIVRAGCNLRGCTLYSARITRHGESANSYPCPSCWQVIQIAGIKTVVYFDDHGDICKVRV